MNTKTTKRASSTTTKATAVKSATPQNVAPQTIGDIAHAAASALAAVASTIPVDPPAAVGVKPARIGTRVPDQAMSIAGALLTENPGRFAGLTGATISDALAYEAAMTPIVQQLTTLMTEIKQTIRDRRLTAGKITLGTYKVLQMLATTAPTTGFPTQLQQLAPLLTTIKRSRATAVTQADTQAAVKAIKGKKVAAKKATMAETAALAAGGAFVPAPLPLSAGTTPAVPTPPTAATH